jgi:hypothetical protein
MFEIRKATHSQSCSNCNNANYENKYAYFEKVDTIYEIKIGIMVNALCADCLRILVNQITEEIEI